MRVQGSRLQVPRSYSDDTGSNEASDGWVSDPRSGLRDVSTDVSCQVQVFEKEDGGQSECAWICILQFLHFDVLQTPRSLKADAARVFP